MGAGLGLVTALGEEAGLSLGQTAGWQAVRSTTRATFQKGAIIRTIMKDVAPESLDGAATLFHEHVGGNYNPPQPAAPSDRLGNMLPGPVVPRSEAEYLDLMVDELKMSRQDGVNCIVDAATARRGDRQVENLRQISIRSGMNLVLAGGYYRAPYPPAVAQMTEDHIADQLFQDANAQRWGAFGEIGTSLETHPDEQKMLRAVGKAHLRTGLPIFTHSPHESCPKCSLEQLDIYESQGVSPRNVCIGHLSAIKPDAEPLSQTAKAIAKRGAFLGFDTLGHEMSQSRIPEAQKVRMVLAVLEAGYEDHVLLSNDSSPLLQLKSNWGNGYSSVVVQFIPKLRYAGVKEATLHKILVDNPRRLLAFVPKKSS